MKLPVIDEPKLRELIAKAQAGCIESRNLVVLGTLRFVQQKARWYSSRSPLTRDELVTEGTIGVIRAIGKFDLSNGVRFLTYAAHWIRYYMQQALDRTSVMSVPRDRQTGAKRKPVKVLSLDIPRSSTSQSPEPWVESISAPPRDIIEDIHHARTMAALDATVSRLRERDRYILSECYLKGRTDRSVGESLGVSGEATRRNRGRALENCRKRMACPW